MASAVIFETPSKAKWAIGALVLLVVLGMLTWFVAGDQIVARLAGE
jgi:hypothetical protein